jgi:hypothetical protein
VPHHEHEEPRLPHREAIIDDCLDAVSSRHSSISSARPPSGPPPTAIPATTASDSSAAAAMAGEAGAGDRRAVSAAILFGDDLDVHVILASIDVAVLDPAVRKWT